MLIRGFFLTLIFSVLAFPGCSREPASPASRQSAVPAFAPARSDQDLVSVLVGRTAAPQTLLLYFDCTPSGAGTGGETGRWQDLTRRATAFLPEAAAGSKLEVWITGQAPAHPIRILEEEVVPAKRRDRQDHIRQVERDMEARGKEVLRNPPPVTGSYIIEDVYRLVDRAGALGLKAQLVVCSDAQQQSALLRTSQIIAARDGGKELLAQVLQQFPRPQRGPETITLVYWPANAAQGYLTGGDEARLKTFFLSLFEAWGAHGELTEPRNVSADAGRL